LFFKFTVCKIAAFFESFDSKNTPQNRMPKRMVFSLFGKLFKPLVPKGKPLALRTAFVLFVHFLHFNEGFFVA